MLDLKQQGIYLSWGHKGILKSHARDMTPPLNQKVELSVCTKKFKYLSSKMLVGDRIFANRLTSENTL